MSKRLVRERRRADAATESPPGSIAGDRDSACARSAFAAARFGRLRMRSAQPVTARWDFQRSARSCRLIAARRRHRMRGSADRARVRRRRIFPAGESDVLLEDANGNGASAPRTAATDSRDARQSARRCLCGGARAAARRAVRSARGVARRRPSRTRFWAAAMPPLPGQDFALKKSPVTYQQDSASISGDNYTSTRARLGRQVEWTGGAQLLRPGHATRRSSCCARTRQGKTHV